MAKLVITGTPPWDGEYPFDETSFTNRELHDIKGICGLRAGELGDAMAAGDTDVLVAIASVAMKRNGKSVDVDDLWDAEVGNITFDFTDESAGDDAGPPSVTPPAPESNGSGGENATPSGTDSENTGETSQTDPKATGDLG